MSADPVSGKVRLNLAASQCTDLTLNGQVRISAAKVAELRERVVQSGQSPDWPWIFSSIYVAGKRDHYVHCHLTETDETDIYDLFVRFSTEDVEIYEDEPDASLIFSKLRNQRTDFWFYCMASFRYWDGQGSSLVPLLSQSLPGNDASGDKIEIRGVRLSRIHEDGKIHFSIVIDRPFGSDTYHTITLTSPPALSESSLRNLLRRFKDISNLFYRLEQPTQTRKATVEGAHEDSR